MKRLVLPAWLGGLALALAWLRDLRTFDDPAFTAARALAIAAATYLVVATILNIALAASRVRVRLPLVPLLIVATLSAPVAATPAFASTPPPVMHRIDMPVPNTSTTVPAPAPPNLSKMAGGGGHSVQAEPAADLGEVSASTWRGQPG